MNSLRETVRAWLVEEKVGLITRQELVRRADGAIAEMDEAPDYLISVSLGERLEHVPELDLVKERITDADCAGIAMTILQQYDKGAIGFDDIGLVALNVASMLESGTDAHAAFDWIDDEVALVTGGMKERAPSETLIIEALEKLSAM